MGLLHAIRPKRLTDKIASRLIRDLSELYAESIHKLETNGENAALIQEDFDVLLALAKARERLKVAASEDAQQDVAPTIAEVIDEIQDRLPQIHVPSTRLGLSRVMARLAAASVQLSAVSGPEASKVETVIIPSGLLFQAKKNLFPAERMQLVSGRRIGRTVYLKGAIDVTGEHSNGHVKADDLKLNDARLDTAKSGSFLAMCLHSHLGEGPAATVPTLADTLQHMHWMNDYWPLLISAIIVKDGYLRLFGDAVERKLTTVIIEGTGIERITQGELDGTGMLFQATEAIPNVTQDLASNLQPETSEESYVTKNDLQEFERGIMDTMRSFLDFFVSYTLELGGRPKTSEAETISAKLQSR